MIGKVFVGACSSGLSYMSYMRLVGSLGRMVSLRTRAVLYGRLGSRCRSSLPFRRGSDVRRVRGWSCVLSATSSYRSCSSASLVGLLRRRAHSMRGRLPSRSRSRFARRLARASLTRKAQLTGLVLHTPLRAFFHHWEPEPRPRLPASRQSSPGRPPGRLSLDSH